MTNFPDRREKEDSIQRIIAQSLPPKPSFAQALLRLYRTIGTNNAFRGTSDAVAAALLVSTVALFAVSYFTAKRPAEQALSLFPIFALAPLLYFCLLAFTSWKERMTGTWQVIAVCRYNLKHLAALRVTLISAMALLILPLCTLPLVQEDAYWKLLVGAYGSLFLYGSLTLLALLLSESLLTRFAVPTIWLMVWIALMIAMEPRKQELLLARLPLEFCSVFAAATLLLYLLELRIMILRTRRTLYAFHS